MNGRAIEGSDIFDGETLHSGKALLLDGEIFRGIVSPDEVPTGYAVETIAGGTILPGFVDLQVNGGGGVMFNHEISVDGLSVISEAHAGTGTRALLPTLITDTPEHTRAAVDAVEAAIDKGVPGIIGIHLEGPHLSVARKGAHDPSLIRRMDDEDEAFLTSAARRLPNVLTTVAPENVTTEQIARLTTAGVIVSLGHTDCRSVEADAAFKAGARCVTHLFNAMSQIENREPGLVGAALATNGVFAGLIADNIHVHATNMRIALSAKQSPDEIFLVTDAMAVVGSDIQEFHLNGRRVLRKDGRLTLEDGTLAGADVDFPTAISVLCGAVGIERALAYRMATSTPARLLGKPMGFGRFIVGNKWNGIRIDRDGRYDNGFASA